MHLNTERIVPIPNPSLRVRCCAVSLTCIAAVLFSSVDVYGQTKSRSTRSKGAAKKQEADNEATTGPRDYRSRNFLLHTDLTAAESKDLLERLETMLRLISRYWGRPNKKIIECYVVKDLQKWPPGVLHENGVQSITQGGGVTMSAVRSLGNSFDAKAVVYAVADRGTPQHEAVHAYCAQAFGTTGPVWYSEGMAEMGQYWKEDDPSVNCHPVVVEYIRRSAPKTLNEIVNSNEITGDSWQNYAWRWALCHLLANNPNYAARFRPLGLGMLTGKNVSFESVYGAMAEEISFEYLFFLQNVEPGYRVDLCAWDWKTRFRQPRGKSSVNATIDSGRGWQASRLMVKQDREYEFSTEGKWKLAEDGAELSAQGDDAGNGRLIGVIFDNYQLGEPFELGESGSFTAASDGNLFLRCRDKWADIADNQGEIEVKFKLKSE